MGISLDKTRPNFDPYFLTDPLYCYVNPSNGFSYNSYPIYEKNRSYPRYWYNGFYGHRRYWNGGTYGYWHNGFWSNGNWNRGFAPWPLLPSLSRRPSSWASSWPPWRTSSWPPRRGSSWPPRRASWRASWRASQINNRCYGVVTSKSAAITQPPPRALYKATRDKKVLDMDSA